MRPVEKASNYHRDIYVGMVAGELNQAGYFGDACRLYGYLYWSEGVQEQLRVQLEQQLLQRYATKLRQLAAESAARLAQSPVCPAGCSRC